MSLSACELSSSSVVRRALLVLRPVSSRCKSVIWFGWASSDMFSFGGDHDKCDKLNELLCQKAGFEECYDVSA